MPANGMRPVPTLYAERLERKIRYRLEVPEHDIGAPLQQEFVQAIDPGTLAALQESADVLLRSAEHPQFPEEARQRGSVLYRTLVPAALRAQLVRLSGSLFVATSLYGLPWELFFDGDEFWGLRYAIGRRILMDRSVPTPAARSLRRPARALIVGADPRGDLPFVREEVERISETLGRLTDITLVSGELATFAAVTRYLADDFDLIHFCGHIVTEPSGESALLLADEKLLSAAVIEANITGHPIVVLNGCASVRGASAPGTGAWEERFSSVAYGFLFGGAMAVVGTLCEVSDRRAARLADEFYGQVLSDVTVGEALRRARQTLRASFPVSPAWLSFVLYGHPGQLLSHDEARPIASTDTIGRRKASSRQGRRRWHMATAAAIIAVTSAGLGYYVHQRLSVSRNTPLVVGVMAIRARDAEVPPWMSEVTRDALNTMLSKVSGLRVYSRQKIDFLREKRQLTEIEAAETLAMSKMLSATIGVANGNVVLELEIVDIASGLLEASEQIRGPKEQLAELQNQLADRALHDLGIQLGTAERATVFADRGNQDLDNYRRLANTLGGAAVGGAPVPSDKPTHPPDDGSRLEWPASAYAAEVGPEERAIQGLLEAYRAALEAKSLDTLATLQVDMPEPQRQAYLTYFGNAKNLTIGFSDVDILIEGDDALATFTRRDTFTDGESRREVRLTVRISAVLAKRDGRWKIKSLQKP
jgi:ketosteroid isomerase-like protein